MKLQRLFLDINWYDETHKMCNSKSGKYIRWSEDLQKLADRDEIISPISMCCKSCGSLDYLNNEYSNMNNFCGNCGQRLIGENNEF